MVQPGSDSRQILRHQYGISVAEVQKFLLAKHPQWRGARRNGFFGRLPFVSKMVYNRAHTVLKSPWNLEEVLEKSLNFCASTWKVLEFSSTLNVVAWREFFLLFGCARQNINHSSVNLMVIYINCSMFYAIIKLSILFKASELKNVKKLVKETVQALKCY